jgi:cell wall-associated NlpC family hydrolase
MFTGKAAAWAGKQIVRYLEQPIEGYTPYFAPRLDVLRRALKPGDVLLVEGDTRVGSIIKYLTQSTWSHAALYIGDALPPDPKTGEPRDLVEALAEDGVVAEPLSKYARYNTRICRPVGLTPEERRRVTAFALSYLGRQYDTRYILDLVRYLMPHPPVPVALRRRMLALGSGDPTRAICSTMIAQAFHEVGYPILPDTEAHQAATGSPYTASAYAESEAMHIRKAGLFTPRDFDISPYFAIVKPTLEGNFDFHALARTERRTPEPDPQLAALEP